MKVTTRQVIRSGLAVIVFILFLNTVPFVNYVNGFISDVIVYETRAAVVGEKAIVVEVADTKQKRIKGLSGHTSLEKGTGMLFIFKSDDHHSIWMKDMDFPIDVIWVNKHFEVVDLEENVRPDSYPKMYSPDKPSRFIVEVNAGFINRYNIKTGDLLILL